MFASDRGRGFRTNYRKQQRADAVARRRVQGACAHLGYVRTAAFADPAFAARRQCSLLLLCARWAPRRCCPGARTQRRSQRMLITRSPLLAPRRLFPGSAGGLADAPSSSKRRTRFCEQPPPLICAHGGRISGGALANTLPAYRRALQHPDVNCVEVDVSRTRDDALVALHQRQLLSIAEGEFDRCAWLRQPLFDTRADWRLCVQCW
jgi:hypothetical protein